MAKKSSKKSNRFPLYFSLGFLALAILFVASLCAAYHDKLLISQITVEGNKTVSDLEIRQVVDRELAGKYLWLYPKRNALLFPREQVIEGVAAAFPRLSSIKVEQENLQSLALSVKERRGEFLWCMPSAQVELSSKDCYFADETGFVFSPAPKFSNPLYFEFFSSNKVQPIGKRTLPVADWQKLLSGRKELVAILADSPFAGVKVYQTRSAELRDWYFKVRSDAGSEWEIRLDLEQDFAVAMKTLSSLLAEPDFLEELESHKSNLEYLDLRFAPKVFYRYNNQ